jgi:hypothetical protein
MWTRIKIAAFVVLCGCALPRPGQAQDVGVYERWTLSRLGAPLLPPEFHDFRPVPPDLHRTEEASERVVLCREMSNAISYAKRRALGLTPEAAIREISRAWRGDTPCGYVIGLTLTPIAYAVRGDDAGRPISILQWQDQYRRVHFTGAPARH